MPARNRTAHEPRRHAERHPGYSMALSLFLLALTACAGPRDAARAPASETGSAAPAPAATAEALVAGTTAALPDDSGGSDMKLTSTAFAEDDSIPARYTCEGEDQSPPLDIAEVPGDAHALALIVDDPDAPGGTFVHWLLWNLSADTRAIPGSVAPGKSAPALGARVSQGTNSFGKAGYGGPCPPRGRGAHTYRFQLYALDEPLELAGGATRAALDAALRGHVIAETTLHGRFAR